MIGIAVAVVIAAVAIVGVKSMLGDEATEMPFEEQAEKTLNLQEDSESGELGESAEDEAMERGP
jgi:hypothetical protein